MRFWAVIGILQTAILTLSGGANFMRGYDGAEFSEPFLYAIGAEIARTHGSEQHEFR